MTRKEVPAYRTDELHEKRRKYCVCVFVINEGEKVRKQLSAMKEYSGVADVIVADGGSTDGSLDLDFLREAGVRALLTKTGPGKLSAQMRMAMAYALEQGYEGVIAVDGNGKDDISAIPAFAAKLDEGWDHVQGSRYIPGGLEENTPPSRKWGVILLHAPLISLAARHRYTDTTNWFRAYSAKLLADPRVDPFRDVFAQYELHYYLAIRAARLGYRCIEIPVTRRYPKGGKTPTKIKGWRGNLLILRTLWRAVTGAYNPGK